MEELAKDQTIRELNLALYEQAKEIAEKNRRIEELQTKLRAIKELLEDKPDEEKTAASDNIWLKNRAAIPGKDKNL